MQELISEPQDLTADWVNLGPIIEMANWSRMAPYIDLDINDSLNVRVRAIVKRGRNDAKAYNLPIRNVSASDVKLEDEYLEFNVDADQKMVLEVETKGLVPFIQLQVMAGTVGATAGQILSAGVEFSNY